ncbi:MAG: hypothetical protein A3F54_04460 [Candidatus Kerfeldbacteria bacterium RIFCSPHIGHO2_12_FULL_48_17]|uniref:Uncharacterized protein n=1 Tax=Candidatus Kerfeldbacteria bacterium RIFCSPHIGHO2_12_FULL_48_17 TaxID=1798542 RepID=A0A1G2B1M2_9BACT|nr:MAG: hypothetical protein A3F54_04460 [Candidatus Kerfeldbacteria bacterium RIFCSPHIGHO2_12_FULL_48_17]
MFEKNFWNKKAKSHLESREGELTVRSTKDDFMREEETDEKYASFCANYQRELEDMELLGNPELKKAIKNRILEVEGYYEDNYKKLATEEGMNLEEVKLVIQEKVEKMVKNISCYRATNPSTLKRMLSEKNSQNQRFKSALEVGRSTVFFKKDLRLDTEHELYGLSDQIIEKTDTGDENAVRGDVEQRPIYGYAVNDFEKMIDNSRKQDPEGESNINIFGVVHCKLKRDSVMKKATFCVQDSVLGMNAGRKVATSPIAQPHFISIDIANYRSLAEIPETTDEIKTGYIEAQFHHQLKISDIEEIKIPQSLPAVEAQSIIDLIEQCNQENKKQEDILISFY